MTATCIAETNGTAAASPTTCDVCVVGAGPAGVMLATVLARLGIHVRILDDRPDQTTVGRADGLQPKTIETLRMLRLGDHLLDTGVRVFDICLWQAEPGPDGPVQRRVGREVHYPASAVDLLHPFILLCHQGMVEGMFVQDLAQSGVAVERGHTLESFRYHDQDDNDDEQPLEAIFRTPQGAETSVSTHYLVGCDGARSRVRQGLAGGDAAAAAAAAQGTPVHESYWAVLDGELATDFPDLWSKTVVSSAEHGSVLIIPRERNLTRFYIEVRSQADVVDEAFVRDQARKVLAPYTLEWRSVEWFGHYRVAQRVAARFTDGPSPRASDDTDEEPGTRTRTRTRTRPRVFIAGDASHTHSPKAAQGMNTSMHDAWNLGWKLNLAVRGLARGRQDSPGACSLLATYEAERKKIAHDLIAFDYEHANRIAGGDADALAANFRTNIGFIAGVGCVYGANVVNKENKNNQQQQQQGGAALPGHNLPPAKATRYVDDNPVDVQLAIPMLGQFRVLAVVPAVAPAAGFLARLSDAVLAPASLVARLAAAADRSYQRQPRPNRSSDAYYRPERYLAHSNLFTFGLITSSDKNSFELADLPPLFSQSKWTVYVDNVAHLDTQGRQCTDKWLGGLGEDQVALINVRPDGYVGSVMTFCTRDPDAGLQAARDLDAYYGGFLDAPSVSP